MDRNNASHSALVQLLQKGSFAIPTLLLTEYKRIGLNEEEVMFILHIMMFQEKDHIYFPTPAQLQERMNQSQDEIKRIQQKLLSKKYLNLEVREENGVQEERYSTEPLLNLLANSFVKQQEEQALATNQEEETYQNIFTLFEREMGRPLSSFECEQLAKWLDEDQYHEELIVTALREAVFSNKLSFRYIDRILLDWQRNNITTPDEAIEYSRKFRKRGVLFSREEDASYNETESFPFYNWVNPYG